MDGSYQSSLVTDVCLRLFDAMTYAALIATRRQTTTAFYVVADKVWGFGLSRAVVPACR